MVSRWWLVVVALSVVVTVALLVRVEDGPAGGLPVDDAQTLPDAFESAPDHDTVNVPRLASLGSWRAIAQAPIGQRADHVAVWTGECTPRAVPRSCGEVLVWGGSWGRYGPDGAGPAADAAAYTVHTDSWRVLPPAPRNGTTRASVEAVWTGSNRADAPNPDVVPPGELVVWGATDADLGAAFADAREPRGAAFVPAADRWRVLPEAPIASRIDHVMVWTGQEVIIWGGREPHLHRSSSALDDGAAYDPAANRWRVLPKAPLAPRYGHAAVWLPTRNELVVWGGAAADSTGVDAALLDGAVYDPGIDAWRKLPPAPADAHERADGFATAATLEPLKGYGVVFLAPLVDKDRAPVLLLYDALGDRWVRLPAGPVGVRSGGMVASTAGRLVVWGGDPLDDKDFTAGVTYHPATDEWRLVPGEPTPLPGASATWVGDGLLVWGGGKASGMWDHGAPPLLTPHHACGAFGGAVPCASAIPGSVSSKVGTMASR